MSDSPVPGEPHEHEAAIRAAYDELPERHLAEFATSTLAVLLDRCPDLPRADDEPTRLRVTAALVGGVRAYRAIRSGMAILAAGYEMEADAMSRALLELFVETRHAVEDASGETARSWFDGGRARGISGRVKAAMPGRPALYGQLSRAAHGDPRALMGLAVRTVDEVGLEWGPAQTAATGRCLIGYAIGARDMAVLLEQAFAAVVPELEALDRVLAHAVPGWAPGTSWDAESAGES
jgi:hypothetical protein